MITAHEPLVCRDSKLKPPPNRPLGARWARAMDRGRLPDPRSEASIAPTRPRREVKTAGSRFWPAAARAVICLYTASRDSSYLTQPGSGMYSPLESRVGVASCSPETTSGDCSPETTSGDSCTSQPAQEPLSITFDGTTMLQHTVGTRWLTRGLARRPRTLCTSGGTALPCLPAPNASPG